MHGLVNKALQGFVCDSFGPLAWDAIARRAELSVMLASDGFEAMQLYDDAVTERILDAAVAVLDRPRDSLLEDLGIYAISNPRMDPLRRLLRFGGVSFTDFLYSLDDLQGRSQLAMPDIAVPELTLIEAGPNRFEVTCSGAPPGFGHVLVGILRALADDYGVLAVLEHCGSGRCGCLMRSAACREIVGIELHDPAYQAGRDFELATELP